MVEGPNFSLHKSELLDRNSSSSVGDFIEGLRDGAYRKPLKAVEQLIHSNAEQEKIAQQSIDGNESSFHRVGEIVGSLVPFVALSVVTKGSYNRFLGKELVPSLGRTVLEQGTTGFVMGAVFSESS